jgi:hypothetical protein
MELQLAEMLLLELVDLEFVGDAAVERPIKEKQVLRGTTNLAR